MRSKEISITRNGNLIEKLTNNGQLFGIQTHQKDFDFTIEKTPEGFKASVRSNIGKTDQHTIEIIQDGQNLSFRIKDMNNITASTNLPTDQNTLPSRQTNSA